MDFFGIGVAVQAMLRVYSQSARGTGRTTALVEHVRSGDRIVFADSREAERVRRICMSRGLDVECRVVDPSDPYRVREQGRAQGHTFFDHTLVEQCYAHAVADLASLIYVLEQGASGADTTPPVGLRRLNEERARWDGV